MDDGPTAAFRQTVSLLRTLSSYRGSRRVKGTSLVEGLTRRDVGLLDPTGIWLIGWVTTWATSRVREDTNKKAWAELKSSLFGSEEERALSRIGSVALSRAVASVTDSPEGEFIHTRTMEVIGEVLSVSSANQAPPASADDSRTLLEQLISDLRSQIETLNVPIELEERGGSTKTSTLSSLSDEVGIDIRPEEIAASFSLALMSELNRQRSLGGALKHLAAQLNDDLTHLQQEDLLSETVTSREQVLDAIGLLSRGVTEIRELMSNRDDSAGRAATEDLGEDGMSEGLRQEIALQRRMQAEAPMRSLESTWVRLPHLGLTTRPTDHPDSISEYLKALVRTVCLGIRELTPDDVRAVEFTGLFRFDQPSTEQITCHMWLPLQELVGWVKDHVPPAVPAREWTRLLATPYEIRFRWGLPAGVLTPMTFWYSPSGSSTRVENRRVLDNPSHFLNPYLCTTTSGFLKFIGAMALHREFVSYLIPMNFDPRAEPAVSHPSSDLDLSQFDNWLVGLDAYGTLFAPDRIEVDTGNPELFRYIPDV